MGLGEPDVGVGGASRVGGLALRAHSWQLSSKESSIQASGRLTRTRERLELPMGAAEPRAPVESQHGQLAG